MRPRKRRIQHFCPWSKTGPSERRRILLAAADQLEAKRDDFVATMAAEVGASALWSNFNVTGAVALFRETAGLTTQIQGETIPTDKPGTLSMTLRQPVGVILSIVPWNGPIMLTARAIAYPIACGNGREKPALIITNDQETLVELIVGNYARPAGVS